MTGIECWVRSGFLWLRQMGVAFAGLYATLPYAVAQGTVEMPYVAVQCIIYSVITYYLIHFQIDAGTFFPQVPLTLAHTHAQICLSCL